MDEFGLTFTGFSFTASNGKKVPAGATVVITTYKLHRRPDVYPNPDKFDPDNFLPERSANRHYYAFVPFSAGPRSCVGKLSHYLWHKFSHVSFKNFH